MKGHRAAYEMPCIYVHAELDAVLPASPPGDALASDATGALVLRIIFWRDGAFGRSVCQFLGLLAAFVLLVGIDRDRARVLT